MAGKTTVALFDRTATLASVAKALARRTDIRFAPDWQQPGSAAPDVVLYDAAATKIVDVLAAAQHLQGVRLVGLDAAQALAFTWSAREDTAVTVTDLAEVLMRKTEDGSEKSG